MSTLQDHIAQLPTGEVINPLRARWPTLFGATFRINDHTWGVMIASPDPNAAFVDVADNVDALFNSLGLSAAMAYKQVGKNYYLFQLFEPMSKRKDAELMAL